MSLGAMAVALFLAGPAQPAVAARPAPPRPGLSWADADALGEALERVERRFRTGKKPLAAEPLVVSEGQLNSYLNLTLAPKIPAGITDLVVHMNGEILAARAKVDLDLVPIKRPESGMSLMSLVSGVVPVELSGRLRTANGLGTIEIVEARLAGISVPIAFVSQIVSSSTRTASQPQGFDLRSPFRLPYAMRRVRLETGRALVDFVP